MCILHSLRLCASAVKAPPSATHIILHDLVVNVPLYFVTGRKCIGWMTLYYLLQPAGILIEQKTRNPAARIFLAWLFVFGAAPLMVNEGVLRVLHLWPE